MAPITVDSDLVKYGICMDEDLFRLVAPDETDRLNVWIAFHEAAWTYHVLPGLIARHLITEEDDLESTDNLKHMTAVRCYILALETRGNQTEGSSDQMRAKALRADYRHQIATVSVHTKTRPNVRRGMRSVTTFRGA